MLKIVRSQLYQLVLDKAIFLAMLLMGLIDAFSIYRTVEDIKFLDDMCVGRVFVNWFSANEVFAIIVTGLVMCKDFFDKTILYEPMAGHSRMQIFMGRFLTALLITEVWVLIEGWGFPLIYSAAKGYSWGTLLAPKGALVRTLLVMLSEFRVVAEFSLFAVLFKRKGFVFIMLAPFYMLYELLSSALYYGFMGLVGMNDGPEKMDRFFDAIDPYFNLFTLYANENISMFEWVRLTNEAGNTIETVKALPDHTAVIAASLGGIGVLALIWACSAFSRKDLE